MVWPFSGYCFGKGSWDFEDRKEAQAFGVQKSKMLIFKPIGEINGN